MINDGVPEQEQKAERVLVINAPELLSPDQNFYDQEPFARIVEVVKGKTGETADVLRSMISRLATRLDKYAARGPLEERQLMEAADLEKRREVHNAGFLSDGPTRKKIAEAILSALNKYPGWTQYILTQTGGSYSYSGELKQNTKKPIIAESYGSWASKREARQEVIERATVREVLQEEFGENLRGKPLSAGSHKIQRWTVLEASDLVRKRR